MRDFRGVFGQSFHPFLRGERAGLGEELNGEQLGEEDEIRIVIRGDVDEVSGLSGKIRERLDLAHLILDAGDADFAGASRRRAVVRIQPFDQACIVVAARVAQVMGHHAAEDEAFAQLEAQHQILQLTGHDALGIFLGRHRVRMFRVVPQPAPGEDATFVEALAEVATGLVEGGSHALTPDVRMDIDIRPVEGVGLGIVIGEVAAIGDPRPGVKTEGIGSQVDHERCGGADNPPFQLRHQLSFGKKAKMTAQMRFAPDDILVAERGICRPIQLDQRRDVVSYRSADLDGVSFWWHDLRVKPNRRRGSRVVELWILFIILEGRVRLAIKAWRMKDLPVMRPTVLDHLEALYGHRVAAAVQARLEGILPRYRSLMGCELSRPLTELDVMLITYGDQIREPGVAPLRSLAAAGRRWWRDLVSAVHILPFYPYSSDDGFSVKDYTAVDPALGDWHDVQRMAAEFELMFDAVLNHMSARGEWFARFLAGDPKFADFFVTVEGDPDLSGVVRPRALPLLTAFPSAQGIRKVWTTFSADQVDLNFKNPAVLLRLIEVLLGYVARGARWIRLDAIAYLWKELGTPCIHLPQTHRVIQLIRALLDQLSPGVRLITETNVPHVENISYFGDGTNEAQLVYNFALPPLVLHTIRTGDATALAAWADRLTPPSDQVTFFNFLASHDGIGLNPARGLLTEDEIEALVRHALAHRGFVSHKNMPDGSQSPYELNINYFDALSDPGGSEPADLQIARFLCAHSILLTLQGVPGIYVHSLLGSRGDREAAEQSGVPRRINRAKLDLRELEQELNQPDSLRARVYGGFRGMLQARRQAPAFRPDEPQKVCSPEPGILVIRRGALDGVRTIWCVHNIRAAETALDWPGAELHAPADLRSVLGNPVMMDAHGLRMRPYEVLWLGHRVSAAN